MADTNVADRMYAATGIVETIIIRGNPDWRGLCVTPPFYVRARSAEQARAMAAEIIDPLEMTGVREIAVVATGGDEP